MNRCRFFSLFNEFNELMIVIGIIKFRLSQITTPLQIPSRCVLLGDCMVSWKIIIHFLLADDHIFKCLIIGKYCYFVIYSNYTFFFFFYYPCYHISLST